MKAYAIEAAGAAPRLATLLDPEPGEGEVVLRVAACGLNFADLLMAGGTYQEMPQAPFALGMEVAGTVEAVGKGAEGFRVGDRVAGFPGHGGLAERVAVPAARCLVLPDGLSMRDAAAMQVAYGTADLALDRARLAAGETLVVLGAAGGVGLTAVELGRRRGATVIACARGAGKLAVAREAGAHHAVEADAGLREALLALGGADVVFDPVGGALCEAAMRACKPLGRVLLIGFASGDLPALKPNHLLVKNLDVIGLYWGGYLRFAPERLTASLSRIAEACAAGELRPRVGAALPLSRVEEGLAMLRERRSTGKVVIEIDAG